MTTEVTYVRSERNRVKFSDSTTGTQDVSIYSDGSRELDCVVYRDFPYCRKSDVQAYVFSFADLPGNLTWEIAD